MKTRAHVYGDSNVIGKNVEKLRKERKIKQKDFIAKLQLAGLDINPTSYSKLEGQVRAATDREVFVIAKVLEIEMEQLFIGTQFYEELSLAADDIPPVISSGAKRNRENLDPSATLGVTKAGAVKKKTKKTEPVRKGSRTGVFLFNSLWGEI